MSKPIESTMNAPGAAVPATGQRPSARAGRSEPDFNIKHVAVAIAILVAMVGIFAYGLYVQQTRTGATQASMKTDIAEISPPEAVASAIPATALIPEPASLVPVESMKHEGTQSDAGPFHADVYFDFGKSRLRADATATLQQQAERLKKEGHWGVLIQGYTDQHGPAEYNRTLALRRGDAVKQFLVELGVPVTSVKVVSLGKEASLCDDPTPTCRRLNRRVHLEIVKLETPSLPLAVVPDTAETGTLSPGPDSTNVGDETPVETH
jgi:peptidoglycan-associated lipoprotein